MKAKIIKANDFTLAAIHGLSFCNEQLIEECKVGYCCHCGKTHKHNEYSAMHEPNQPGPGNWTVMCPDCNVDCVIPNIIATKLGPDVMRQFKDYWFGPPQIIPDQCGDRTIIA